MPSLAVSRDLAREASCKLNQRNIYMVIQLYANDYNQSLPYADRTHNRYMNLSSKWGAFGCEYDGTVNNGKNVGMMSVLPPRMKDYMDPFSGGWLCPGWPVDKPYVDDDFLPDYCRYVVGTPTDPDAGSVRNSPRNVGMGYEYAAYIGTNYTDNIVEQKRWEGLINFDRARYAATSRVTSCLPTQQGSILGRLGPHHRSIRWNILWADGAQATTRGIYNRPPTNDLYENSSGDWLRDRDNR
jgi:hypothetical protein